MRIRPGAGAVSQTSRLEQHVLAELQAAVEQHLEHVAVHRPAAEGAAARELVVDARAVPGQRVALVPAPLLRPELEVGRRAWTVMQGHVTPRAALGNRGRGRASLGGVRPYAWEATPCVSPRLFAVLFAISSSPLLPAPPCRTSCSPARRCGRSPPPTTSPPAPSPRSTACPRARRSCSGAPIQVPSTVEGYAALQKAGLVRRRAGAAPAAAPRPPPPAAAAAAPAPLGGYTVRPGDTLSGLAAGARVSAQRDRRDERAQPERRAARRHRDQAADRRARARPRRRSPRRRRRSSRRPAPSPPPTRVGAADVQSVAAAHGVSPSLAPRSPGRRAASTTRWSPAPTRAA